MYSVIRYLGLCKKVHFKLDLKPGVKAIFRPKRPVSYAHISTVDDELNRLEKLGIISSVNYSDWAAPIVVVRKQDGRVRVCADYSTGLNDALEPHQYPLPSPDDIFSKLSGSLIFSHLDLSDAFLQVEVEEHSKKLLCINTHKGIYQFNRLPPGVKTAPAGFQQIMDTMLAGIDGVAPYIDDVIVSGPDMNSHLDTLQKVFDRIREYGFHLNINKCKFFLPEIKYLGRIINRDGVKPDPEKIQSIIQMPAPSDISTLRSYLGGINYYGKFIKHIRTLREPLDKLLKKDTKFIWSKECQKSFDKFKEILQSDLLLTHYDPKLDIIVAAYASNHGVGACLLHRMANGSEKAVYHVSRALTPAEQNYSQIEKEGLALIFATTKFHRMIFGRKFILQTDHKPLLSIFGSKKGIPVYTANRLQRWALQLLMYDFEIRYISTTEFGHADILSRLINKTARPEEDYLIASVKLESDVCQIVNEAINQLPVTSNMIRQATAKDKTLKTAIKYVNTQWPNNQSSIQNAYLKQLYSRRESLTCIQGCLIFGERIISITIPKCFQSKILKQFHRCHPGVVRMKSLMRSYVYWPGMDKDVEDYVRCCTNCALAAKSPPKEAFQAWPETTAPWERIHIDYAGPLQSKYYLVIVDAHTKWPEIYETTSTTTPKTIEIPTYRSFC